ncbi:hypothetical protein MTYP_03327 [Methylophilaceae bacterium]|nr:hypothetical protein MTYP_03327 [Methylophilaceae bacterium]
MGQKELPGLEIIQRLLNERMRQAKAAARLALSVWQVKRVRQLRPHKINLEGKNNQAEPVLVERSVRLF